MGLFDKKYCDVCGEKIGLLGNRKLEDGNLCKDCAKKLSPFFSERRQSTVEEIKQQLAYREQNEQQLAFFNPTRTIGSDKKVYVDEMNRKFIITSASNWREYNPDIIELSQVTSVNVDIEEERNEITRTDSQGNEVSYNPPRYEYEYIFNVEICVDSPWFNVIEFELTEYRSRPDSRYSELYRNYEREADELRMLLMPSMYANRQFNGQYAQPNNQYGQQMPYQGQQNGYAGQGYPQYTQQNGTFPQQPQQMQGGYNQQCVAQQPNQQSQQVGYSQQQYQQGGYTQPPYQQQGVVNPNLQYQNAAVGMWVCQNCNTRNTGKFCEGCGSQQQQPMTNQYNGSNAYGGYSFSCDKCGWIPSDPQNIPRFCPQCGAAF